MKFIQRTSCPFNIIFFILSACTPLITSEVPSAVPTVPVIIIPTPHPTVTACTSLDLAPTPGPDTPSLFPPASPSEHSRGAKDAVVTIIIYNDFQCTDCNYLPLFERLLEDYPDDLRIIFRPYPYIALFDKGELAARAAEAAAEQDKFWEMHDHLFETQDEWVELSPDSFKSWVTVQAVELELDENRFTTDFNSTLTITRVQNAAEAGANIGIPKLPFYLLNGQIYSAPVNYEAISQVINLIKLGERQFTSCPPMEIDPAKQYIARIETENGDITLQLYADKTPLAVNSFVFLARQGWFDGITFHRVLPGFVAQPGDPSGTGQGNPGYMFNDEIDSSRLFDQAGLVGMANSGSDTNGSQFFITYAPAPKLDGSYTIFGKVLNGMDVLERLTPRNPQPGLNLPPGDKLISVTIEEK